MKTKAQLWLELLTAAVAADSSGEWFPEKLGEFIDKCVAQAEMRGFVCAPIAESTALRALEKLVRDDSKFLAEKYVDALAVIDQARKGIP